MTGIQLQLGELQEIAEEKGVDPDQDYQTLKEKLGVKECKWCSDELVDGWDGTFCTETCEVEYINEYYR